MWNPVKKSKRFIFLFILGAICLTGLIVKSCNSKIPTKKFTFFLNEPCMIVNMEQDNTVEGTYLKVTSIDLNDSTIVLQLPESFKINNANINNWIIGWGTDKPYYDAGVENLRKIKKIDLKHGLIYLGKLVRGNGFPIENQRLVFWNINPSGFKNIVKKPIIDPALWPEFSGKSVNFSSVKYDSVIHKWVMIFNECDHPKIQVYAAISNDLIHWEAANNGEPILTTADFKNISWAGVDGTGRFIQTPFVSDFIKENGKWYLFMDGYSNDGKRHIGIASSLNILGPYKVRKKPILSPGIKGSWNDQSVFYAKVKKYKKGFIMFFDGRNSNGIETIGMATSRNLLSWKEKKSNPVIDQHAGWRSNVGCTEPNYIEIREDSILLMIAGVKNFQMDLWHRYVTNRMYRDISGNVDDAQLGVFLSTDGGNTFYGHKNNPIYINDYSNEYENEHMGGNFQYIETDSAYFILYQAKSSYSELKYNILARMRYKN